MVRGRKLLAAAKDSDDVPGFYIGMQMLLAPPGSVTPDQVLNEAHW